MTPTPTKQPVALTIGESLAHMSRAKIWAISILSTLILPAMLGVIVCVRVITSSPWSLLTGVPWRLALLLAWCAYLSVAGLVESYANLYLPRAPMAVAEKTAKVGFWIVGAAALGLMVALVLVLQVKDTRVLAACTAVPAALVVGLVAFWVWLARTYGGDGASVSVSSDVARLPV